VVEIGTFTGYSTLCMARALPPGGRLITCDITARWLVTAQEYWRRAGVTDRIDVRIGPATETLAALVTEQGLETVDLVFIDADKANYVNYYEAALRLVRPGGLIVVDNTLFFGRVLDPAAQDRDTVAIRQLNTLLRDDHRVDIALLVVADGITLARKNPPAAGLRRPGTHPSPGFHG
jgi:O-methyltransferase